MLLKECVKSILDQTFQNFEVWIIDGGSNDETLDFLKTLKAPFNWVSEKDRGVYDAMNKGIDRAKGEWLYFFGDDDKFYSKNVLNTIFTTDFKTHQIIAGNIIYDDARGIKFLKGNNKNIKESTWSFDIWIRNSLHHQATFYKKDVFKNNRYSLENKILSDYEFNLKLFNENASCCIVDEFIAICGISGLSKQLSANLYREEIKIKTKLSSKVFQPIFWLVSFIKYNLKRL